MNRLGLVLAAALAACTCPPTTHVEQTYASPLLADSIQLCATEGTCVALCSRAFFLEAASIDRCRIVSMDHHGGAHVEVTWSEYVCQFEEWSTDDGSFDDGYEDDYEDDYDPCSDGSCDPGGGDDEPPPDDDDPPPDDDPPMDEGL